MIAGCWKYGGTTKDKRGKKRKLNTGFCSLCAPLSPQISDRLELSLSLSLSLRHTETQKYFIRPRKTCGKKDNTHAHRHSTSLQSTSHVFVHISKYTKTVVETCSTSFTTAASWRKRRLDRWQRENTFQSVILSHSWIMMINVQAAF